MNYTNTIYMVQTNVCFGQGHKSSNNLTEIYVQNCSMYMMTDAAPRPEICPWLLVTVLANSFRHWSWTWNDMSNIAIANRSQIKTHKANIAHYWSLLLSPWGYYTHWEIALKIKRLFCFHVVNVDRMMFLCSIMHRNIWKLGSPKLFGTADWKYPH